jgi:hypothetical protein
MISCFSRCFRCGKLLTLLSSFGDQSLHSEFFGW